MHQLTGDFYTVGEILGHTLKGIGMSLGISTNLEAVTAQYEIPVFHKALSECGSLEVRPVAICVPQEIQEYCMELFGEDVQIAAASHDLFAKRANGQIYRPLVEKYIAGEKRL